MSVKSIGFGIVTLGWLGVGAIGLAAKDSRFAPYAAAGVTIGAVSLLAGVLAAASSWRREVIALRSDCSVLTTAPPRSRKQKKTKKKSRGEAPSIVNDAPSDKSPHKTSLGAGVVPPCFARIDWASLLQRVYLEDVLRCPCGGRRRIIADICDPDVIVTILDHLRLEAGSPPVAHARDPTFDDGILSD